VKNAISLKNDQSLIFDDLVTHDEWLTRSLQVAGSGPLPRRFRSDCSPTPVRHPMNGAARPGHWLLSGRFQREAIDAIEGQRIIYGMGAMLCRLK
jgi:hypothetical protein